MQQLKRIKFHYKNVHIRHVRGKGMLENVTMLARSNNKTNLPKFEALMIKQHNPVINKQVKDFPRTLIFLISLRILHNQAGQNTVHIQKKSTSVFTG